MNPLIEKETGPQSSTAEEPQKRTAALTPYLKAVPVVLGAMATALVLYDRAMRPALAVQLLCPYSGFEIRVSNKGRTAAQGIHVDLSVWAYGAPGAYNKTFPIRDLGPGSDSTVYGALSDPRLFMTFPGLFHSQESVSGSGYIVASCTNCPRPSAWAFHLSSSAGSHRQLTIPHTTIWRIVEFRYPDDKPGIGRCVDFPKGACADTSLAAPSLWDPKSSSR